MNIAPQLTDLQLLDILERRDAGESYRSIARFYGRSHDSIRAAVGRINRETDRSEVAE